MELLDSTYIKAFLNGQSNAFDVIYSYYYQHVYQIGFQYFHNREAAEEITQNTFMEIYCKIDRLRNPEAFPLWMNQIARNKCHSYLRYQMKDTLYYTDIKIDSFLTYDVMDQTTTDNLHLICIKDTLQKVTKILSSIDKTKSDLAYLWFYKNLTIKEISSLTHIPTGTISSSIHRTKILIRSNLDIRLLV